MAPAAEEESGDSHQSGGGGGGEGDVLIRLTTCCKHLRMNLVHLYNGHISLPACLKPCLPSRPLLRAVGKEATHVCDVG